MTAITRIAIAAATILTLLAAPASGAQPAHAAVPIKIGYSTKDGILVHGQLGQIFERTDILRRNHLEGVLQARATVDEVQADARAEQVDVAMLSGGATILMMSSQLRPSFALVSTLGPAARMGFVTRSGSTIKTFRDLKGRKLIDYNRGFRAWMEYYDMPAGSVEAKVEYVYGPAQERALASGAADALHSWSPFLEDLVERGVAREFQHNDRCPAKQTDPPNPNFEGEHTSPAHLLMSRRFIEQHPEAAANFLAATKEALHFWLTHKELVNGWVAQAWGVSPKLVDRVGREVNPMYREARSLADLKLQNPAFIAWLPRSVDCWFAMKGIQGFRRKARNEARTPQERAQVPPDEQRIDPLTWADWAPAQRAEQLLANRPYQDPKVLKP